MQRVGPCDYAMSRYPSYCIKPFSFKKDFILIQTAHTNNTDCLIHWWNSTPSFNSPLLITRYSKTKQRKLAALLHFLSPTFVTSAPNEAETLQSKTRKLQTNVSSVICHVSDMLVQISAQSYLIWWSHYPLCEVDRTQSNFSGTHCSTIIQQSDPVDNKQPAI